MPIAVISTGIGRLAYIGTGRYNASLLSVEPLRMTGEAIPDFPATFKDLFQLDGKSSPPKQLSAEVESKCYDEQMPLPLGTCIILEALGADA